MKVESTPQRTYEHQPEAALNQAAPVSTTWYTVLAETALCKVHHIMFRVQTTGEDLECELTVDGEVYTATQAAVAGTAYYLTIQPTSAATPSGTKQDVYNGNPIEGKLIQVRLRKTSAAGAGNLQGYVGYDTLQL